MSAKLRKNGVAPKDIESKQNAPSSNFIVNMFNNVRNRFVKPKEGQQEEEAPPKTWKERLTWVADNAKNDKDAPSYLGGHVRCYLVFDTESEAFYWWLMVVNFAVLYNLIFVIGRSCFWEMENIMPVGWLGMGHEHQVSIKSIVWLHNIFFNERNLETDPFCCSVLDYICDFLYLVDIFVRVHEGYLEQGLIVKDAKLLRKNYLKGSYITDIISIFPTDFAYFAFSSTCHEQIPCPVVVRLNRIFRIYRMFDFLDKTETRTSFPNAFRITKIIFQLLILIHWDACFFFAVSFFVGFETDIWVYHG